MVDPAFITPFGEKPDFAQRATWADRGAEPTGSQKKPGWFRVRLSKRECKPNPKIRAKGASRTLTTRAMAAAPGALTPFNGAHRHHSWLGARTSRFIGLRLVRRLHFGYILDASIRLHCFLTPRRVLLRIHAYGPF